MSLMTIKTYIFPNAWIIILASAAVLESVGVTDVLAKSKGSSNPHNLVKATIVALGELRDARTVAQNRGVSLDTVFNG